MTELNDTGITPNFEWYKIALGIFVPIIIVCWLLLNWGSDCCMCGASSGCCPCPNSQYIEEVSEYHGYSPSSAGSWAGMCNMYKEAKNLTFDCFV